MVADDNAGERVSLHNVKVDSPPNLDSTASTDPDADESDVSTEPELEEVVPNGESTPRKRKKISNYYDRCKPESES